jgi:chromosome partitioning protein
MGTEGQEPRRKHRRFFASRRPNEAPDPTEESSGMSEPTRGPMGGSIRPSPPEQPPADPVDEPIGPEAGQVSGSIPTPTPTPTPAPAAPPTSPEPPVSTPESEPAGTTPEPRMSPVVDPSVAPETTSAPVEPVPDRIGGGRRPGRGSRRGTANPLPGSEETGARPVFDEIPPLQLPAILAVANQKGGVGKTTTAVNLGAALAELDYRVLVVDLDPQGNATTGLGINARDLQMSIYDVVMNDAAIEDCVEPTSVKHLFVAPATIDLAGAEIELVPAFSRELKLRRALEQVRDEYDFTLIDCPPSLGLLTVNALAAADGVIVPIQCEYYALEGLGQLLRNVALVRSNLNPTLDVRGIVLTMYDARTKLADQVEQEVRAHFGPKVYRHTVPRNVRIGEAPSYGKPITVYDPMSRGAIAYRELAREVSSGSTRRIG